MTKFAFVFPGQGSQSRGMMNGYADFAAVRDTFTEASDVLKQDLWQLVAEGSDADLNATVNTQPIMLTAGVAVYRAWQSQNGAKPAIMAGHSLGEYTALVAAGALSFADALPLVRYRAQCMQQAVPEGVGGIAAILGLDDDAGACRMCRRCARRSAGSGELQFPRTSGHCRQSCRGRARHGTGQGQRRKTRHHAADERTVALQPAERCGGTVACISE